MSVIPSAVCLAAGGGYKYLIADILSLKQDKSQTIK